MSKRERERDRVRKNNRTRKRSVSRIGNLKWWTNIEFVTKRSELTKHQIFAMSFRMETVCKLRSNSLQFGIEIRFVVDVGSSGWPNGFSSIRWPTDVDQTVKPSLRYGLPSIDFFDFDKKTEINSSLHFIFLQFTWKMLRDSSPPFLPTESHDTTTVGLSSPDKRHLK